MSATMEFLNPRRKLVDEVADWLCGENGYSGRVRTTSDGVISLDHVMVVVPTAQSGRNLRLAIAKRFVEKGIIPPRVVQPMHLVRPADETVRVATRPEIAAAFQQFVKSNRDFMLGLDMLVRPEEFEDLTARFALLNQLEDIWRVLAGRGLLMRDVGVMAREKLAAEIGDEALRWQQLAALEERFFGYLSASGLAYPTQAVHAARTKAAIVSAPVEEIVLPALADPLRVFEEVMVQQVAAGMKVTVLLHADESESNRFNEWGRPITERWVGANRPDLVSLTDADIIMAADTADLADKVADGFPDVADKYPLPSLALCDGDLYEDLAAAFLNKKYVVHNPGCHRLDQSSLGFLIRNLMAIYCASEFPWREFVSLLRSDDVMAALGCEGERRSLALGGLDAVQNAYIPQTIPSGLAFPENRELDHYHGDEVAAFFEVGRKLESVLIELRNWSSLVGFIRKALQYIFACRMMSNGADEREFAAAADAAREFLNSLECTFIQSLPMTDAEFAALFKREFESVTYSLEPDTRDAIRTEGWLELAWSSADKIALAGLHEGKVPDSVVGHPFLPDSLRQALGLVSNTDRLARDSWMLKELLDSHAEHAVRAFVARGDANGDICRPSRLLYLCDDSKLASRVSRLFGNIASKLSDKSRCSEIEMKLHDRLPAAEHISPSAIDTYIKCPFTYLLQCGLSMRPYKEKRELEANDFGTLAHMALEAYAHMQIARGDDQLTDADDIKKVLREEIFPLIRGRFGRTTLNIELQLESIEGRLMLFAEAQAKRAAEGWRIRYAELKVKAVVDELGFTVKGCIDRVDENISADVSRRWCIVDYKTWDKTKKVSGHVYASAQPSVKDPKQYEFARLLGYPLVNSQKGNKLQRMLTAQLPLYGKAFAKLKEIEFSKIAFDYLILGESADDCAFFELSQDQVAAALTSAKRAKALIDANIFWPPGPSQEWKWNFAHLFVTDPETDIGKTEWAKRQLERLEALHD